MKKKLKIFMDHQIFTMQDYGGISRVFAEMYRRFRELDFVDCDLPIVFSENIHFEGILKTKGIFRKNKSFIKRLTYYLINHLYTFLKMVEGDYDVFLPSYYDPYFLPFLGKKPFVLVLHDMTHEIFPDTSSTKDKTIAWKRKLAYKADKIIAISENTKRDIIKFYDGIDESKIEVVYWGTTLKLHKTEVQLDLPNKYILFVGNREKYKNFNTFFQAVFPLLKKDFDLSVVCAGSSSFSEREINMIKKEGVMDRVKHIRFKDDNELAYIYNNAICLVYPSLYEGFGSPILEAFSCECPVVLSNTSSLPEIGGNAVVTFDPENEDSIRKVVKKVIEDSLLRKELVKKGKNRIKMFTYEKTVDSYIRICQEISNK
jgi:glycosyltransferase involved in cell wall biosynthesis